MVKSATTTTPDVTPRWATYAMGFLIASVLLGLAWVPLREGMWWLATQPDLGSAFQDPRYGRHDAWISLFSFLLLVPFAAVVMLWVLGFIYALPAGVLLPLGRRVGFPEWMSSIFVVALSGTALYAQSDVWLDPCLRGLGLLARAALTIVQ